MKKIVIVLVMLFAASTAFAQFQLGTFPVGKWLDPNYDAVWEFTSNNIRILSPRGTVLYDFDDVSIYDFSIFLDGTQPGITFACIESKRRYRFIKPLTNNDVIMEIQREGMEKYTVHMPKQ